MSEKDIDMLEILTADVVSPPAEIGSNLPITITDKIIENDKLYLSLREKDPDRDVQDTIMEELAIEVFNLNSLRDQAPLNDLAARAIIAEKRILALKKLSEMVAQRTRDNKSKAMGLVDFHSDNFKAVLSHMTEIIIKAVKDSGMQESLAQRFYLKLKEGLTGFEDAASNIYSNYGKEDRKAASNKAAFAKVD